MELILALKGAAAGILETIPISRRNKYNELMAVLQSKFGDEQKRELYRLDPRCRTQKPNEPLQWRFVQLTYPAENHQLIDNIKTEAFVNGIHDPDIKLAVYSTQKIVAFAVGQETARTISRPSVSKVRKMEVVEKEESLLNKLKEMLKQVEENGQKTNLIPQARASQ